MPAAATGTVVWWNVTRPVGIALAGELLVPGENSTEQRVILIFKLLDSNRRSTLTSRFLIHQLQLEEMGNGFTVPYIMVMRLPIIQPAKGGVNDATAGLPTFMARHQTNAQ